MTTTATKHKKGGKTGKRRSGEPRFTADTADRHILYELSVQNVESEIDFVDATFEKLRGRRAARLREDFCGTGNTSCEWARRRDTNVAWGLDIDQETLDWGQRHNTASLAQEQAARVQLLNRDVLEPADASGMDCILAMNFSYWLFKERKTLRGYFERVRDSLVEDGVFFLDFYGGSDAMSETQETRKLEGFTYVWDQKKYNPVTGELLCHIHFRFPDRTKLKKAFTYSWRFWTLPEVRELLEEAGFKNVTVYWEGDDDDGGGNGEFEPTTEGEADPSFICYITAER